MVRKQESKNAPSCLLSHAALNKLSVIIGSCDLALQQMKASKARQPQTERRVAVVREMAWELVNQMREYGCQLDTATRSRLLTTPNREQTSVESSARLVVAVDKQCDPLKAHS